MAAGAGAVDLLLPLEGLDRARPLMGAGAL